MRVIISKDLTDNLHGYKVERSFKHVMDLKDIECLIIHNYTENDFDAGVFVSKLHSLNVGTFIYINSAPAVALRMVILGVGGAIFEDEFYFEDVDELNSLVDDVLSGASATHSLAVSNIAVISDFMQAFARNDAKLKQPLYLDRVNSAISDLQETTKQQEFQLTTMGSSAVAIFEKASKIITSMSDQQRTLQDQLEKLMLNQETQTSPRDRFNSGDLQFFPSHKYFGTCKVLFIRELSPCRYLTSFLYAYRHHVHYEKNKRCKLIFVHQKGKGVSLKYSSGYTSITQESMHDASLYHESIIATNNPKQDVLRNLLANDDVIIVVDRLYGAQDIVTGKVVRVNAVSGLSDLARYNVQLKDTIFTMTKPDNCLFCIPHIQQYPGIKDSRIAKYVQTCSDSFTILDKRLGI